ncbi:UDP-N-acetylmuramyl pentapeptide phosphotransferase/UDP-N-acetylglucosamine-1-phosphate transferase [Brevibacterium sp. Mu109]|uniref:glycosyltransferase family 4 protein n=1 Tax=Brevibacterium sp. Mu109 TaxID=1255669 RepID=UPI000C38401B|nr:hypothetical protein [Brevibacterium sp. Mu109]SMX95654.1 UDP-N-acetylmuramyl pentapeptide phosphotransferase/UDP-N-acetylglucosamine-1-phosphate transferase [Brevibacterium sp. Mu109]
MMLIIALACALAAAVSYLSARFAVIPILQRRGVLDHPTARSSHDEPVARGGGIAVFAGLVAGCATALVAQAVSAQGVEPGSEVIRSLLPLAAAALFGLVGLIDDLNSLSAVSRLVTQVVLAGAFAVAVLMVTGVGVFATVAVVLSIIVVVNGTNFMDGLNTLVPAWGAGTGLWFGVLGLGVGSELLAIATIALTAALAGFLPLNATPARSFLGDVGSYAIGGFLSVGAWVLWSDGAPVTALLAPFVIPMFDVLYTLGRRIYRGENLFTAHRSHIYQKLQTAGLSHEQVSAVHLLATGVCVAAALPVLFAAPVYDPLIAVAVWSGVIIGYAAMPTIVSRRQSRKPA